MKTYIVPIAITFLTTFAFAGPQRNFKKNYQNMMNQNTRLALQIAIEREGIQFVGFGGAEYVSPECSGSGISGTYRCGPSLYFIQNDSTVCKVARYFPPYHSEEKYEAMCISR
jgi:hypothetical protein